MLRPALPRRGVRAAALLVMAALAVACGSSSGAAGTSVTAGGGAAGGSSGGSVSGGGSGGSRGGGSGGGGSGGGGSGGGGHVSSAARDLFTARVAGGRGTWTGASGRLTLRLHLAPGGFVRRLVVTVSGRLCRHGCTRVRGTLRGSLKAVRRALPDTGSTFKLRAAGSFKPIGRLTAVGTVHGTGFIDRGRELLRLTLSGSRGLLELIGRSSAVPAFTSP